MARAASERFALLAAEWLRVGYVQSNFNADNCLMGGATLDYGPFGFIERYEPGWSMWIGGGQHFSFMNQPAAAQANLKQLLTSLEPLMSGPHLRDLRRISAAHATVSQRALGEMWARKMGLPVSAASTARELFGELEPLLQRTPTDWTLWWRQLAEIPAAAAEDSVVWLRLLSTAFYSPLDATGASKVLAWLHSWLEQLRLHSKLEGGGIDGVAVGDAMRLSSPKFVPREWMLVEAYEAAERGEYGPLRAMHALLRTPYEEHPEVSERFYRRAPSGAEKQGGIGFMS